MDWLNTLSKEHNRWLFYVKGFGAATYSEDIVQEMYIKLYEMSIRERDPLDRRCASDFNIVDRVIKEDGTCNYSYVWFVLRSLFLDIEKQKGKVRKVELEGLNLTYEDGTEDCKAYGKLLDKVDEELKGWNMYDRILFDIYSKGLTMRDISNNSDIGLQTIFYDLKRCKNKLRDSVKEDYEDYKNEDYELI